MNYSSSSNSTDNSSICAPPIARPDDLSMLSESSFCAVSAAQPEDISMLSENSSFVGFTEGEASQFRPTHASTWNNAALNANLPANSDESEQQDDSEQRSHRYNLSPIPERRNLDRSPIRMPLITPVHTNTDGVGDATKYTLLPGGSQKGEDLLTCSDGYCYVRKVDNREKRKHLITYRCAHWTKTHKCHAVVMPRHVKPTKAKGVKRLGKGATSTRKGANKGPLTWITGKRVHTCQKDTYKPYVGQKARRDLKNLARANPHQSCQEIYEEFVRQKKDSMVKTEE